MCCGGKILCNTAKDVTTVKPEFTIRPYAAADRSAARELLGGRDECAELLELMGELPDAVFVAVCQGQTVAFAGEYRTEPYERLFSVYVDPDYRRMGIATALHARIAASRPAAEYVRVCFSDGDEASEGFAASLGYEPAFAVHILEKTDLVPADPGARVIPYEDRYFEDAAEINNSAFLHMRRKNDLRPYTEVPDEGWREGMAEAADSIFLVIDGGKVCGMGACYDGELTDICVAGHARGRGLGRALVQYAVNMEAAAGGTALIARVYSNSPGALELFAAAGFKTAELLNFARYRLDRG